MVAVVVVVVVAAVVVVVQVWASFQTNVEPTGENSGDSSVVFGLEFGLVDEPSSSLLLPENLMADGEQAEKFQDA